MANYTEDTYLNSGAGTSPIRREKLYDSLSTTDGYGRKIMDAGGDGGSKRGGKAKRVISKTFDQSGQTDLQVDTDDDGTVTTNKIVTPSGVLEAMAELENYNSLGSFQSQSIAEPSTDTLMAEGSPNGRSGNSFRPSSVKPYGPLPNGRYLSEDEYLGVGNASLFDSAPSSTSVSRNFLGNTRSIFGNVNIDEHGYKTPNFQGTLGISDSDRANAQSKIIAELNEEEMLDLSVDQPELYAEVVAGNVKFPSRVDPHANKDYTTPGFDGSELHAAAIELEEQEKLETTLTDSLLEDETFLSDDMDLTFESDVKSAVQVIAKEDPNAIAELNKFADWADTVPDADAQAEAERYLQSLADEPSVNSRFKKAMAIAMAAMLFGDDFGTAMNTGFGVVADDYADEEAKEVAAATTQAALDKKLAQEKRTSLEWDRQKQITFALDMKKEEFKLGAAAAKANAVRLEKMNSDNYAHMKDVAGGYWDRLDEKQKKMFGGSSNFAGQYARALDWSKNNTDVVWDFKNNNEQVVAFNTQFEKWLQDSIRGYKPPAFSNYMQDAFIKTRLEGNSKLAMKDTNPSVSDIADLNIDTSEINWNSAKEVTVQASNKIKTIAGGFNEASALALLAKDFYDWKDSDPEGWAAFSYRANENGVGGFIAYINSEVKTTDAIGTMYMKPPEGIEWNDASKSDYIAKWLKEEALERNKSRQS